MPGQEPLDLWTLLRRRNTTFEQWCASEGIETYKDFLKMKLIYESGNAYYFSSLILDEAKEKLQKPAKKTGVEQPEAEIVLPKKKVKKTDLQDIENDVSSSLSNVEIKPSLEQSKDDVLSTLDIGELKNDS